jgi:glycosyltransferase involved in cell wall biosynthesis
MKILHISKYFPPYFGGMELFVSDLVWELARTMRCDVLCANTGARTAIERRHGTTIVRAGSIAVLGATALSPAMVWLLRRVRSDYDIVSVHLPNPMAALACYLTRPRGRLVLHWQSDVIRQRRLAVLYRPLETWLLRRCAAVIVTTDEYRGYSPALVEFYSKCTTIPLGLDPCRLVPDARLVATIRHRNAHRSIIFSAARLVYYKGLEYLIPAMRQVDGVLLIGGTGPLAAQLQRQIADLGLGERIKLLGHLSPQELASYYAASDVVCLASTSRAESFGIVQLEAMALGKPVVSTAIPGSGVSWVNQDGITGLVVPPRDSDALAAAIQRLCCDKALREELGANGRRRLQEVFGIERVAEQIRNLYETCLTTDRRTAFGQVKARPTDAA